MKRNSGNTTIWVLLIVGLIIWFFFFRGGDEPKYESYSGDDYSTSSSREECAEPENPYSYGSGHYAGFEWGEENEPGYCDGNSDSFIEGCEDYLAQQEEYESCLNQ